MKKLIIIASIFLCTTSFAEEWDMYAFTDYTPVRVMHLKPGADVELEASKAGLSGAKKKVQLNELPTDRSERDFWKAKNGSISVDQTLKKKHDDDKAKKQSDKESAINKLKANGLTEDELVALKLVEEK